MLKQSEIAAIILVTAVSLGVSFFIASAIVNPGQRTQEVLQVESIDDSFPEITSDIFPEKSINPTQQVRIGGDNPEIPFQQSND